MNPTDRIITRHLFIEGRVQGVYYRASMVQEATRLGVQGWVRNRSDGRVEAWLQGPAAAVEALIDWAHRGPERAHVTHVAIQAPENDTPPVPGFIQL